MISDELKPNALQEWKRIREQIAWAVYPYERKAARRYVPKPKTFEEAVARLQSLPPPVLSPSLRLKMGLRDDETSVAE